MAQGGNLTHGIFQTSCASTRKMSSIWQENGRKSSPFFLCLLLTLEFLLLLFLSSLTRQFRVQTYIEQKKRGKEIQPPSLGTTKIIIEGKKISPWRFFEMKIFFFHVAFSFHLLSFIHIYLFFHLKWQDWQGFTPSHVCRLQSMAEIYFTESGLFSYESSYFLYSLQRTVWS